MQGDISYEDKLAFITSYMMQKTHTFQVELLEEVPFEWEITKQVDYLYERITNGVEVPNPTVRFNQPKQAV